MPLDLSRLARVRAHFLSAVALLTGGCGTSDHAINEPIHVNKPRDPPPTATAATPTATPQADAPPADVNTPPTGRTPVKPSPDVKPDPAHVNTPRPPG